MENMVLDQNVEYVVKNVKKYIIKIIKKKKKNIQQNIEKKI